MTSKYETEVKPDQKNNSHALMVNFVGRGKKVLDVGSATGYVAGVLTEQGCRVTGMEIDPRAAREAEKHCERVIVGDVELINLHDHLAGELFDVVLFGDVLEHLRDPLRVLQRVKPFLSPEGYVVASIPNIAHGSVRLALLQGKFQYRSLGLLDNTHLRFFTRESVEQLFKGAGFYIKELARTRVGIFSTEIDVDRGMVGEEVLRLIEEDPESRTYQFVLTACPSDEPPTTVSPNPDQADVEQPEPSVGVLTSHADPAGEPSDGHDGLLVDQLRHRERMIYELHQEVRNLDDLKRRLGYQAERLAEREEEVRKLTEQLVNRNARLANNERTLRQLNNRLKRLRTSDG